MHNFPRNVMTYVCNKTRILSTLDSMFSKNKSSYVQGQVTSGSREYFYYVDHQRMLFLDDSRMKNFTSCIKEPKFLRFFFKQLRFNETGRHEEFAYVSPCAGELNFVRCDDLPVVFTTLAPPSDQSTNYSLTYNHAGGLLRIQFEPGDLFVCSDSGRLYHSGPKRLGGVGLVRSILAHELSDGFSGDCFRWMGETYEFSTVVRQQLRILRERTSVDRREEKPVS